MITKYFHTLISRRKYEMLLIKNCILPWQVHSEHKSATVFDPQQSNPSKAQPTVLISSSQKPFPIIEFEIPLSPATEFDNPYLLVLLPMHSQCVQYSLLTQCPQQSPPSKIHSALFTSSLQTPFLTNSPWGQSIMMKYFNNKDKCCCQPFQKVAW